ncbi:MAG: ATP-grasp domain-containing protein [Lachnospiraceae bacterium]|nr:ATP-grasp domain-containing protein [Lachnospiraceae bacterium]
MEFSKIRVLVTEAGGKQSLAMVRGLKELGCHVTVVCDSKWATCYVSNLPDRKLLSRYITKHDQRTLHVLLKLVKTGEYDVLMPIGELGTNFVTAHEDELSPYVRLACAPRVAYLKAFNKQITFDTAIEDGIPCPYTRHSKQAIEDFLDKCHFPIIIKPRQGLGSIGFHKFYKREDFWPYMQENNLDPDDYVVQEFVNFDNRIGTNLFMDKKGNICTSYAVDVLRWFPIDAGAGVLIVTMDAHEVLGYAGKLLKALNWQGFANVAFMVDKESGEPRLLEINGRIPASVKMAYMCGCNVSRQLLEMVYDEEVTQYPENDKFGMYIRHLDTDIAWFIKSPERFKTKPSWFSWKNTQEILFSMDDMKPFFANFIHKVLEYRTIMRKKKH